MKNQAKRPYKTKKYGVSLFVYLYLPSTKIVCFLQFDQETKCNVSSFPCKVTKGKFELQKRLEPRLLPQQQQIMHDVVYYMGLNVHAKFALLHSFHRYAWFCVLTSQTHLPTSSAPNLHIRRNLNFSERKKNIAKKKNAILL